MTLVLKAPDSALPKIGATAVAPVFASAKSARQPSRQILAPKNPRDARRTGFWLPGIRATAVAAIFRSRKPVRRPSHQFLAPQNTSDGRRACFLEPKPPHSAVARVFQRENAQLQVPTGLFHQKTEVLRVSVG